MERKGLSQILYLIIAASVLMMIAMVITFTATDTIGGLGGSATESQCQDAVTGKCTAVAGTGVDIVEIPSTCVSSEADQFVTTKTVYDSKDGSGGLTSSLSAPSGGSTPYYVYCN